MSVSDKQILQQLKDPATLHQGFETLVRQYSEPLYWKIRHFVLTQGVAARLMADEYFDGDEAQAQLQEAIARLPDVQRVVFNLRYYDEMKYSEISKILHTSEGAIKASYHIAVQKITEYFRHKD